MQLGLTQDLLRAGEDRHAPRSAVGWWLLGLAAMVYVMVVLGGSTRLTGSGLSMVEWRPFSVLPPLSEASWQALFAEYRASPQFQLVNNGMTLAGFKGIFWLEYLHRLWGRLIGVAFLIPFLVFVLRGQLGRADVPRLALLFLLGAAQGGLGWFMVKSGLVDRPEVSHYRLAAHLLAALLIYAALLWSGLGFLTTPSPLAGEGRGEGAAAPDGPSRFAGPSLSRKRARGNAEARTLLPWLAGLLVLVVVTISAGTLVAGLHAGMIYNTFPLMNGRLLPPEAFDLSPSWLNAFENLALVQFDHRLLAVLTWTAAVVVWLRSRAIALPRRSRRILALIPLAASAQAGLGIATLLLVVPVSLAVTHQAGAFLLFSAVLWGLHELSRFSRQASR